ncbi:type II toxin-antitoxin system HigB family toxin [Dyadobacter sp. CY323]|uniref:type II toxin-antitoxin system HigB family toxin n=1 Tax=Dyadobacter sp. CY323 TaxID=2907302 RepID=UPI001F234BD8|nr:type II toxin-antitoxin system HigB family toxin [Dyadobacter sp. CY323]MCE6990781.1 type II toxin-antitoxin system HigB family toxin [Dyadobacter sp. CY323]
MRLEGKKWLYQLKKKNLGNVKLCRAIDRLIADLENADISSSADIKLIRKDAEKVHNAGFYFLDILVHRTLILVTVENGQIEIVWAGSHQEYEKTFKNNKNSVEKWLRNKHLL